MPQTIDISKSVNLFGALVDMIRTRDKCSRTTAIDKAMREQPELFEIAKSISAARVLKEDVDAGGRVISPTRDRGHATTTDRSATDPFNSTRNETTPEAELARMRAEHGRKVFGKWKAAVEAKMTSLGLNRSQAIDRVAVDQPDLHRAAIAAQPISHPSPDTSHSERQRAWVG
jgi:hypothetical protein